ncbi:hypothetical protein GYH30_023335 [Glycine max]|nr:hypothetical protein GYH30_023335 [Glycine max]
MGLNGVLLGNRAALAVRVASEADLAVRCVPTDLVSSRGVTLSAPKRSPVTAALVGEWSWKTPGGRVRRRRKEDRDLM